MKKSDFTENEDELLSCECEDCGASFDEEPEMQECEDCGSMFLTVFTRNESKICCGCGHIFDIWDTTWEDNNENILCEDCFDELED